MQIIWTGNVQQQMNRSAIATLQSIMLVGTRHLLNVSTTNMIRRFPIPPTAANKPKIA